MIEVELRMIPREEGVDTSIAEAENFARVNVFDTTGMQVAQVEIGFDREWNDDGDLHIGVGRFEDRQIATTIYRVRARR